MLRLGLMHLVTQVLPFEIMLPAPGQGALAVQCRGEDERVLALLALIDDADTHTATRAERKFLEHLGGGCSAPIGAYSRRVAGDSHEMSVFAAIDGQKPFVRTAQGPDAEQVSESLARHALAHFSLPSEPGERQERVSQRPLAGRRIVVTRPADQATDLIDTLEQLGASVLPVPTIAISAIEDAPGLGDALAALAGYRWIVFTSTNAVQIFVAALEHARA